MIRAVLDTNVLASGFVGLAAAARAPGKLLRLWQEQRFALVVSADIQIELLNTLADPYFRRRLRLEEIEEAQLLLQNDAMSTLVTVHVSGVATHPEDDLILATALSVNANYLVTNYLVTGDDKLQKVGNYRGVQIVSPRDFLTVLASSPS